VPRGAWAEGGRRIAGRGVQLASCLARVASPKVLTMLADAATIALVMVLAFVLRPRVLGVPDRADPGLHLLAGAVSLPLWTMVFASYRLYTTRRIAGRLRELEQLVHALIASTLLTAAVSFLLRLPVSRLWILLCFPLGVVLIEGERELVRRTFAALRRRGSLLRRVVIVGTNDEAVRLSVELQDPSLGYKVLGFAGVDGTAAPPGDVPLLGTVDELLEVLGFVKGIGVLIATTAVDSATSNRLARQLTDAGFHVELSSSLLDIRADRLIVSSVGSCPMIYIEPVLRGGWRALAKRTFDVSVAVTALVIAAPLMLVVALIVKLDSPGPVLFRQTRVGRNGQLFSILKFRTMVQDAEKRLDDVRHLNEADGPLFKIRRDPRVTRVGRVLRAFCVDELPQFWNVLRNEMSLVGPRPALPSEVDEWSAELYQRLRVKPGVTGMWQVNGRVDVPFEAYARADLYYVDNWSLWADLAIVAKTLPVVLLRRGGY
jgi:exopolysaccharide biosynthesis polyprenyl glycosylphosphotransferase